MFGHVRTVSPPRQAGDELSFGMTGSELALRAVRLNFVPTHRTKVLIPVIVAVRDLALPLRQTKENNGVVDVVVLGIT